MPPRKWLLQNPHHLSMAITLNRDGSVSASFPAVPGCEATVFDPDQWKARDAAILACAKMIVAAMEVPDGTGTDRAA